MKSMILASIALCACVPAPSGAPSHAMEVRDLPRATNASPPVAGADQIYRRAEFDCGIAVSYPAHWGVLTREMDLNVQANAQARGGRSRPSGSRTLLLLNSTPEPHGAQLRLVIGPANPDVTQSNLLDLANDETTLEALSDQMLQQFRRQEATGGVRVITMRPARVEQLEDHASVHLSYDRASLVGGSDWRVDQYQIPVEGLLVQFTISYRIEEEQQWGAILAATLASLDVGNGCHS